MRPAVIIKAALTLDGQLAAADGSSRWITSPPAREQAHMLRAQVDGVMVGAGTVRADDPELTVRLPDFGGAQPRPVVVAGRRPLPADAKVLQRDPIILSTGLLGLAGTVIPVPDSTGTRVDLELGLERLAQEGVGSVLVEGGPSLLTSVVSAGLADRAVLFFAAKLAMGTGRPLFTGTWACLDTARPVKVTSVTPLADAFKVEIEFQPA